MNVNVGDRAFIPREEFAKGLPDFVHGTVVELLDSGRVRLCITQGSKVHRDVDPRLLEGLSEAGAAGEGRTGQFRAPTPEEAARAGALTASEEVAAAFAGDEDQNRPPGTPTPSGGVVEMIRPEDVGEVDAAELLGEQPPAE